MGEKFLEYYDDLDGQQILPPNWTGFGGSQVWVGDQMGHMFRSIQNALAYAAIHPQSVNFVWTASIPQPIISLYVASHTYALTFASVASAGIFGFKGFSNEGVDLTSSLTWSSSPSAVATVNEYDIVTFNFVPGAYVITASDNEGNSGALEAVIM